MMTVSAAVCCQLKRAACCSPFISAGKGKAHGIAVKGRFILFVDKADPAHEFLQVRAADVIAVIGKIGPWRRFAASQHEGIVFAKGLGHVCIGQQQGHDVFVPCITAQVEHVEVGQVVFLGDSHIQQQVGPGIILRAWRQINARDALLGNVQARHDLLTAELRVRDHVVGAARRGANEGVIKARAQTTAIVAKGKGNHIVHGDDERRRAAQGRTPIGHMGHVGADLSAGAGKTDLLEEEFAQVTSGRGGAVQAHTWRHLHRDLSEPAL